MDIVLERMNKEMELKWDNWFLKDFPYSHKKHMLLQLGFKNEWIETILKKSEYDDEIYWFVKALLIIKDGLNYKIGL